jgi:hypothetical protein
MHTGRYALRVCDHWMRTSALSILVLNRFGNAQFMDQHLRSYGRLVLLTATLQALQIISGC